MKIVFVVDSFPVISETFILNQITGMIERGHDVEIFSMMRPLERDFHKDISRYNLLKKTVYYSDMPENKFLRFNQAVLMALLVGRKNPRAIWRSLNVFRYGREALGLANFYKLIPFISYGEIDIIQCHFGPNGNIGVLLKEFGLPVKTAVMFHGYDIRLGIKSGGEIYKKMFDSVDCIQSISEYNYRHLVEFGADPEKIIHHPVGVDLQRFSFRPPRIGAKDRKIRIITIARFIEEKGLINGLTAIKQLTRSNSGINIEYHLVGDGPLHDQLRQKVDELGLKNVVHFIGSENQEGIKSLLGDSDIFFLPSKAEALPVVLMEAQAVGLPVVASDVGSVHEIVEDGKSGFLVDPDSTDEMTERLERLIRDTSSWKKYARRGREIVEEKYNIDKLNDSLEELYANLIKKEGLETDES